MNPLVEMIAAMPTPPIHLSRRSFAVGVAALTALIVPAGRAAAALRTGDLIGEPTYYMTRGDETLLDIAMERNLGVPEISAVNPGVDPWVPGAETLITLPTQFLLPDAPHKGIVVNYGGPGELVSDATGVRLPMQPRSELIVALRREMERLADDYNRCRQLGSAAVREVSERWTWDAKAVRVIDIYRELLGLK